MDTSLYQAAMPVPTPIKPKVTINPVTWLTALLSNVPGSVKGTANLQEIVQSLGLGIVSGGAMNSILAILGLILTNVPTIFPNPVVGGLVTLIVTFVIELIRRVAHGADPAPTIPAHAAALTSLEAQVDQLGDEVRGVVLKVADIKPD